MHRLTDQGLPQGSDQRDAATDGSFEEQIDASGLGRLEELAPDVRQQLLVRGDHGLPGLERRPDEAPGGLDATDELHHHVDAGVGDDGGCLVREAVRGQVDATLLGEVPHRDPADLQRQPGPGLDGFALLRDEPAERRSHVPATQHADCDDRSTHGGSRYRAAQPAREWIPVGS